MSNEGPTPLGVRVSVCGPRENGARLVTDGQGVVRKLGGGGAERSSIRSED